MIKLENVTKTYGTEVTALRDANFDPEFFTTIREIQAVAI